MSTPQPSELWHFEEMPELIRELWSIITSHSVDLPIAKELAAGFVGRHARSEIESHDKPDALYRDSIAEMRRDFGELDYEPHATATRLHHRNETTENLVAEQIAYDLLDRLPELAFGCHVPSQRAKCLEIVATRIQDYAMLKNIVLSDIDPIGNTLKDQPLKLYRFLKDRNHWTCFDTLRDQNQLWRDRRASDSDSKIERALRRLRTELNRIAGAPQLSISRKNRRTKLD